MRFSFDVSKNNTVFFVVLAVLIVISSIAFAVNPATKPNPGHASNEVEINISGTDMTLQYAIDNGFLGPGKNANVYCKTVDTKDGLEFNGYNWGTIDLTIEGRNICEDTVGCTYSVWEYTINKPAGSNLYLTTQFPFKQKNVSGVHYWIDAKGNQFGINGDTESTTIIAGWNGFYLFDDKTSTQYPPEEIGPNALVYKNAKDATNKVIIFCDY